MKTRQGRGGDTEPEDTREAGELSPTENADLCAGCVKCCTYITIEVDAPRAAWEYDQWIWALHHRGVELFVEKPERWFVHFETVCDRLDEAGRCSIYGRHPRLCREYDPRSCERRFPLGDMIAWFKTAYELERWIAEKRPVHYRRLMAFRKDTVPTPANPDPAPARRESLIPVAALMATLPSSPKPANGPSRKNGSPSVPANTTPRKLR